MSKSGRRAWRSMTILWKTFQEINKDRILLIAAGVTFYTLLALFPAVAAFVSLYGLVADAGTIQDQLARISVIMPAGALDLIADQIRRINAKGGGALSFAFVTSLAISLWSANAGMKAMFDSLNVVFDEEEKRSFFALNLMSLLFTFGAILFLILLVAAVIVVPVVLNFVGLGGLTESLVRILRWPALFLMIVFALAFLYRFGPDRESVQWRWISWGSAAAAVLWILASMLFSWYVANFAHYNETYGSLGAAIGFMTWIWLSSSIVLTGAELNAALEAHQNRSKAAKEVPRDRSDRPERRSALA